MSDNLLPCVEVEPNQPAVASVIWLHGLGADGNDFEPIVPQLGLPANLPVRFIFPHAPVRPVTLNFGMPMRAWYDIVSLTKEGRQDDAGIRASEAEVHKLIQREHERGVPANKIVIAGFSQGGAVALHTGVRYAERLAGIMGLSTYLPLADKLTAEAHTANQATPIFLAHGSYDDVVKPELGTLSRDALQAANYTVDWRTYPMAHQVVMAQIRDIGQWLSTVLAN